MTKLKIGALLFSEKTSGEERVVLNGMELLLCDGRPIERKSYPRLHRLLGQFGYCLPALQGSVEGVDQYVVARRVRNVSGAEKRSAEKRGK